MTKKDQIIEEITEVSFHNVSFEYSDKLKVFDSLNLCLHKKKITTIIGKSGSGKSTLVKLLMRLYSPDNGEIKFNDKDASIISDQQ